MNWQRYVAVFLLLLGLVGCGRALEDNTRIFAYEDFGPSALSADVLGNAWWQWENQGDGNPATRYPIKIVVYWNIPLDQVKAAYPVIPEKKQDYRYIERGKALAFLDSAITDAQEFQVDGGKLLTMLQDTRQQILPQSP